MAVGLVRFIIEYSYKVPECGDPTPDPRPAIVSNFHYLYFSIFAFGLTGVTAIIISLLSKPIDQRCVSLHVQYRIVILYVIIYKSTIVHGLPIFVVS